MKVAKKAGVFQGDDDKVIVLKLRIWISSTAPDLAPDQVREKVELEWHTIKAAQNKPTTGFPSAWMSVTG